MKKMVGTISRGIRTPIIRSGDKGTPVVYIQGYFDNYTSN